MDGTAWIDSSFRVGHPHIGPALFIDAMHGKYRLGKIDCKGNNVQDIPFDFLARHAMPFDIPMRFESERLLWWVDDVYTPVECAAFIELIERSGPTLATNNPMYRNQDRVMRDDPGIATDLFQRLRPYLPEKMGPLDLVGLNDRLRFYRYNPGQRFEPHMDHWYRPDERQITLHTVLVYFNDDFEGGETRFQEQIEAVVHPRPGTVVLFQHKIRHEGCEVFRGKKYAMRSDVIYGADEPLGSAG
jgi:prolyl 4-hydroxylase